MTQIHKLTATLLVLVLAVVASPAMAADRAAGPKVNVNTADEGQLALLPRVGPALASRIVEHREATGPFASPQDLVLVRGIGEKTFSLMEPYVAVDGETTLTEKARGEAAAPSEGR